MAESLNLNGILDQSLGSIEFPSLNNSEPDYTNVDEITIGADPKYYKPDFGRVEAGSLYNPFFQSQYKPRYEHTFAYDELGFDPHKDNETLYNQKMSGFDTFQRAGVQMLNLAGLGFIDKFTPAKIESRAFENAMAIGQSSRDGLGAFAVNTMLSAGYTLGLLGEMAAEDLALAAITTASFGTASPVTGARFMYNLANFANRTKEAWSMANAMRREGSLIGKIGSMAHSKSIPEFLKNTGKFFNPFENTTNAVSEISRLGDSMSKGEKATKAIFGVWHDMQGIYGAYSEGRLEGAFAEQNMKDDYLRNYQATHSNMSPTDAEWSKIDDLAKKANFSTTMANVPLIFVTNKITMNALLRPLNKIGATAGNIFGRDVYSVVNNGIKTIKRLPTKTLEQLKFYASHPGIFAKNQLKYSLDNFMEGFQEVSQDIISGTSKDYYGQYLNNDLRGSWYDYLLSNTDKQMSMQGLETFASGMLMQKFVNPVQSAVGLVARGGVADRNTITGKVMNKAAETAHSIFHSKEGHEKWKKERDDAYNKQEEMVDDRIELLNQVFEDPTQYFNPNFEQMAKSKAFSDLVNSEKYKALPEEDKKEAVRERFADFVSSAVQSGQFDMIMDQMESMKSMNEEDLKNAFGESRVASYKNDLQSAIDYANQIKQDVEDANKIFQPLFSQDDLKEALTKGDYNKVMAIQYANIAQRKYISDYLFEKNNLKTTLEQQKKIIDDIKSKFNGASDITGEMPFDEISSIYDSSGVNRRLLEIGSILHGNGQDSGLDSLDPTMMTPSQKQYKKDLEAQESILRDIAKNMEVLGTSAADETKLKSDVNKYIKLVDEIYNGKIDETTGNRIARNNDLFYNSLTEGIINYAKVAVEKNYHTETARFLTNPNVYRQRVMEMARTTKEVHKKRKEEIKNSLNHNKRVKATDKLVQKLNDIGVFIRPGDLEELEKNHRIPKSFIYNNESIYFTDPIYQQALTLIQNYFREHGIEVENIQVEAVHDEVNKNLKDRTEKELVEKYLGTNGFDKLDKPQDIVTILKRVITEYTTANFNNGTKSHLGLPRIAELLINSNKLSGKKIKFISETKPDSKPLTYTSNEITINLRYFASNYMQSDGRKQSDVEYAILKGTIGAIFNEELKDVNSTYTKAIKQLFESFKNQFNALSENHKNNLLRRRDITNAMSSIENFVMLSITNDDFQSVISQLKSDVSIGRGTSNIWQDIVRNIVDFFRNAFHLGRASDNSLFSDVMYVVGSYINDSPINLAENQNTAITNFKKSNISTVTKDNVESVIPEELLNELKSAYVGMGRIFKNGDEYTDEFINWIKSDNALVNSIVNSYINNKEYNERQVDNVTETPYDFNFESEQSLDFPFHVKNTIFNYDESGTVSSVKPMNEIPEEYMESLNAYKTITAIRLMLNGNKPDSLYFDNKAIYDAFKDDIDNIIADINKLNSGEYKGPNGEEWSDVDFTNYLIDVLGFPKQEVASLANKDMKSVKRLVIENITYNEKKRILKKNERKNAVNDKIYNFDGNSKTIYMLIEECKSLEDLKDLEDSFNLYLNEIPRDELIQDEAIVSIRTKIKEKRDSLESSIVDDGSGNKIEIGTVVYLKTKNGMKPILTVLRIEGDKVFYQKISKEGEVKETVNILSKKDFLKREIKDKHIYIVSENGSGEIKEGSDEYNKFTIDGLNSRLKPAPGEVESSGNPIGTEEKEDELKDLLEEEKNNCKGE